MFTGSCTKPASHKEMHMSLSSGSTQQKFPFPYDAVFDGLVFVIPQAGFRLKSQDKVIGRITASAGASLFFVGREPRDRRRENR